MGAFNKKRWIVPIFLILLFLVKFKAFSQNETNNWYFGYQAALNFSTNPPTILNNSSMFAAESGATISDANGNLLFYTNGETIWNSVHAVMANGNGLLGNSSSTEEALIVKQPGNQNIYYVFTQDDIGGVDGFRYSIVDMNLAASMGSVTTKNVLIHTPSCEKIAGVKHCNGKDIWIISHDYNSNQFRANLLTSSGLNFTPVLTSAGSNIITPRACIGHLKASPDGRRLASTIGDTSSIGSFELFDFDNSTGFVSNPLTLRGYGIHYGCEFSLDGKLFYGTYVSWDNNNSSVTQWNLCAGSNSAIISSSFAVSTGTNRGFSMQMAKNNKIYINHAFATNPYLSVINNPNGLGATMGYSFAAQSIAPNASLYGLVNFVTNNITPLNTPSPFTHFSNCSSVNFISPPQPTFAINCTSLSIPFNSYVWDFGEPSSGVDNTSTLSNPQHVFSTIGTYTVRLIVQSNCATDTLWQQVTISSLTPTFAVSGPTAICKGEKATISVSANVTSSYSWSSPPLAGNVTSVQLSPTSTSQYTVIATNTASACKYTKVFQLQVNKCTDLKNQTIETAGIRVYPLPAKDELIIDWTSVHSSSDVLVIQIFNQNSQLIFQRSESDQTLKIDLSIWPKGLYLLKLRLRGVNYYKKLVIAN